MKLFVVFTSSLLCATFTLIKSNQEGTSGACYSPTSTTFLLRNGTDGAELVIKDSRQPNPTIVTYEDSYLSSTEACVNNGYERCQIVNLTLREDVLMLMSPLGSSIGIATFSHDNTSLTLANKSIISVSSLNLNCELTSIAPSSRCTVVSVCMDTSSHHIHEICINMDMDTLTASVRLLHSCLVANPSNFIIFDSSATFSPVVSFLDEGNIWLMDESPECHQFEHLRVCSNPQRFIPVSPREQAIYCAAKTYIFDSNRVSKFLNFTPSTDGVPFFCSNTIYCAHVNLQLGLHFVMNKSLASAPMVFNDSISHGDCTSINSSFYVVLWLSTDMVMSVNLNITESHSLGVSTRPPQVFQNLVLLSDDDSSPATRVYDLTSGLLVDELRSIVSPYPGFVLDNGHQVAITCPAVEESTSVGVVTLVVAALAAVAAVVVVTVGILCWWKRKETGAGSGSRNINELELLQQDGFKTPSSVSSHSVEVPQQLHNGSTGSTCHNSQCDPSSTGSTGTLDDHDQTDTPSAHHSSSLTLNVVDTPSPQPSPAPSTSSVASTRSTVLATPASQQDPLCQPPPPALDGNFWREAQHQANIQSYGPLDVNVDPVSQQDNNHQHDNNHPQQQPNNNNIPHRQ